LSKDKKQTDIKLEPNDVVEVPFNDPNFQKTTDKSDWVLVI